MPELYDNSGIMQLMDWTDRTAKVGQDFGRMRQQKEQFDAQLQQRQREVALAHVMDMVRVATDNARFNRSVQMQEQQIARQAELDTHNKEMDKAELGLDISREQRLGREWNTERQGVGAMQQGLQGMMGGAAPQGAPTGSPQQTQQPAQVASFQQPMPGQAGSPMQAQGGATGSIPPDTGTFQPITATFQPTDWRTRLLPTEIGVIQAGQNPNANEAMVRSAQNAEMRAQLEARQIDEAKLRLHTEFLTLQQQGIGDQMLVNEVQAAMQTGDPAMIDGALQKIAATKALYEQQMRQQADNEFAVNQFGQMFQELAPAPDSPGYQVWEQKAGEWQSRLGTSMSEGLTANQRVDIQDEVYKDMSKTAADIASQRSSQARYDIRVQGLTGELANIDGQIKAMARYSGDPAGAQAIAQLIQQRSALVSQQSQYAALQAFMRPNHAPADISQWDAQGNNYRAQLQEIALKLSGSDPNMSPQTMGDMWGQTKAQAALPQKYQEVLDLTGWQDSGAAAQTPSAIVQTPTLVPSQPSAAPLYAVNQQTGERIVSTDGGQSWQPAPRQ